jgi:ABC-2 type transport system permease protein
MMNKIVDGLNISWAIALKDVKDAFKNRGTRTNILVLVGMVVFFYWMSTLRPFDKTLEVVILDEGTSSQEYGNSRLGDGTEIEFRQAGSFPEFEQKMAYRELGIILPGNFDQQLSSSGELTLSGYIHWAKRNQVAELEKRYSENFSELLGQPTRIVIGENILLPQVEALGMASTAAFHVFFAIVFMALTVVPFLMLEERQSKTLDALLVSPASPGLVVLGKAMAGMILVIAIAGISIALNGIYVIHWGWAILGFFLTALFAIGLALLLGSLLRAPQQIAQWMLPVVFLVVVPGFFADEPNLTSAAKSVINWLPGVPFNRVLGFSVSNGSDASMIGINLGLAVFVIAVVYGLVIWQVRRSDR